MTLGSEPYQQRVISRCIGALTPWQAYSLSQLDCLNSVAGKTSSRSVPSNRCGLMSPSGMVEIPRLRRSEGLSCRRTPASRFALGPNTKNAWIPACAGMTETEVDFQSTYSEPLGLEPRVVQSPAAFCATVNPYFVIFCASLS